MKPPHIPNEPYHPPPPRRKLPLQSPELCHQSDHRSISLGPICLMGSPANIGTPALLSSHCSKERLCPKQHSSQRPGPFYSSHNVSFNQSNICPSADRQQSQPPTDIPYISTKFMRDVSNYTSSFHIRRDQVSKPKATLSFSGSKNLTAKNQDSNKHRPHVSPSRNTRAAEEVYPQQHSDCESQSGNCLCPPRYYKYPLSRRCSDRRSDVGVPIMHSPARPDQDQQHKQVSSSVKSTPAVKSDSSSLKRRRESEDNSASPSLVSSLKCSSDLKLQKKTTDGHLCTEPACGQSSRLESSSCASVSNKQYIKKAYISSSRNQVVKLRSSEKPAEGCLTKTEVETVKKTKCCTLFSPKITNSLPHMHSTSVLPVKTPRTKMGIAPKTSSKLNSGSQVERNKTARPRRPGVMPNCTDELFTPDPISLVSPAHKKAKSEKDGSTIKSNMPEKSSSSTISSTQVAGSSCGKTHNSTVRGFTNAEDTKVPYSVGKIQVQLPSVTLERIKLENIPSCSKDGELKNSPITFSGRHLRGTSIKSEEKDKTLLAHNVTLVTGTTASKETFHFPEVKKEASEKNGQKANEENSVDADSVELDLSFALDFDLAQSSQSSEEEQLLSLQEMMNSVAKPPDTPEKGAFSEPSTPGYHSRQLRPRLSSPTKPGLYKNNLDQLLKEINTNKKAKKSEEQLLLMCKEDLLRIAEYEEDQEQQEEAITSEQQEFVQRYTLMSDGLREVPPGEAVFNLEKFGQIFNQDTLHLRKYMVKPQGIAQKTLLWSSPAQLRSHVTMGLFQEAYDCQSPCPTQVSRFLFKMMSVHTERLISEKILEVLCDIACTAACQTVESESQQFKVWVPSLADVTLVLLNMGVPFVSLFPFENLQPPFTEGDLLEDVYIKSESPSHNKEQKTVPEHNYSTILKYLSLCMGLCPRAYSNDELLLLLAVLGRVSLDTQLILQPSVELFPLLYKIINNFRDWKSMLARICLALTDLTDDHHNMCLLVQQLPDNKRGKQLRQHLSLSMISKLLNGKSTYRPTEEEFQLSALRPYLPAMQPSTIVRGMLSSSSRSSTDEDEDMAYVDQQSYYLCYSLLTLTNEASNFQSFPAHQNDQLLCLYSELDLHVKCDIRESEKCLYRSKVKDLVSRIDIKWQNVLQKTKPFYSWSAV